MAHLDPPAPKSAWPELLGTQATLAALAIAHDRPDLFVEVIPTGSRVTPGYNPKRVRVYVNQYGFVSSVPVIG